MRVNDFMLNLLNRFQTEKNTTESTATKYIQDLFYLNDRQQFNNLQFLRKYDDIDKILNSYADSTRKSMLGTILAGLSFYKDKSLYKTIYNHYRNIVDDIKTNENNKPRNVRTKKQEDNWITWDEIQQIKNSLYDKIKSFGKKITDKQYEVLLHYFAISLYTDLAPRRNQDYQMCYIVKEYNDSMPDDKNYLDLKTKQFIFNKYKTSKKYKTQKISFADNKPFLNALNLYLKHHPLYDTRMSKNKYIPLLVNYKGVHLSSSNSITRLLNKIFGKNVGATMLRHIYLSSKYGDLIEEQKTDANDMGHSIQQQKDYIVK